MNMRRGLALAFATATFAYSSTVALHCQEDGNIAMTSEGAKPLSDREKSNLRGPVRSVIEESLQPAWTDGDGKVYPESRSWRKTEYDREGRTAETRFRGSTGEWVTRYTYAEAGMLLRTIIQDEKGETKRRDRLQIRPGALVEHHRHHWTQTIPSLSITTQTGERRRLRSPGSSMSDRGQGQFREAWRPCRRRLRIQAARRPCLRAAAR